MREFAKDFLAEGLDSWKGESDMIAMIRGDAKDFRTVAKYLGQGDIHEAFEAARCMDTDARDQIPDKIWNSMGAYCYPGYF